MKSLSLSQPHAIVMVGIPGSGKTQFAKQFSETFSAPLVDGDLIASHARDGAAAANLVREFAIELLKTRQSIIVDTGGSSRKDRMELSKFLRDNGYEPLIVWVQIDTETAQFRTTKKRKMSQDAFDQAVSAFTVPGQAERPLVISGKHTYASQARTVLKRLSEPRALASPESMPLSVPAARRPGTIRVQ